MSMQLEPETIRSIFIALAEAGKVEELGSLLVNRPRDCVPALGNALIEAAKHGRYDVVVLLLEYGALAFRADASSVNSQALHEARMSTYGLTRIIRLLEEKEAYFSGLESTSSECPKCGHELTDD